MMKNKEKKNESMTVESFVDELFKLRDEGKSDKDIAVHFQKYFFFILKNRHAIKEECDRRHLSIDNNAFLG